MIQWDRFTPSALSSRSGAIHAVGRDACNTVVLLRTKDRVFQNEFDQAPSVRSKIHA